MPDLNDQTGLFMPERMTRATRPTRAGDNSSGVPNTGFERAGTRTPKLDHTCGSLW